jgi:NAD-dependent DNA ligase
MQYKISPRRLEDALCVYNVKGNLDHVLPKESNLASLRDRIMKVSLDDEWKDVVTMTNNEKLNFLQNVSNVVKFKDFIIKDFANYAQFVPEDFLISKLEIKDLEWLDAAVANPSKIPDSIVTTMETTHKKDFSDILKDLKNILPSNMSMNLNGKNVVVTGKFTKRYKNGVLSRDEVSDLLQRIGAKVQAAVNNSTNYLIVEDKTTTTVKMQKAQQLGVTIISEDEFHAVYGNF